MTAKALTPDFPTSDNTALVGLIVNNFSDPLLVGNVTGMISNLFDSFHFEQWGEMTPEQAAEYYRNMTMIAGDICELVAECIASSQAVSIALEDWFSQNIGDINRTTVTTSITAEQVQGQLLPPGYVCDNDKLAGMARWVLSMIHDSTLEIIQEFEASTNQFEFLSLFVDNFEGVSWLGGFLEMAVWYQDNIQDLYDAAYTQAIQDQLFCRLYCSFQDQCVVSVETIWNAYLSILTDNSLTPPAIGESSLQEFWDWFLTLSSLPDLLVVTSAHFIALVMIKFQNVYGNIAGLRTLEQMIALGADETSLDYVLCEPCNPAPPVILTTLLDFVNVPIGSYENAVITPIWGNQTLGEGWYGLQNPDGSGPAQWGYKFEILFDTPVQIDKIRLNFNGTWNSSQRRLWLYNGATLVRYISSSSTISVPGFYEWNESGKWGLANKVILHTKLLSASAGRLTTVEFTY